MNKRVYKCLTALAVWAILSATAAGCSPQTAAPATDSTTTVASTVTTLPTDTEGEMPPVSETAVLCETPYLTVVHPDYWDDRIEVKTTDGVGAYTLRFSVTLNGKEAELFSFTFGGSGGGYRLGRMTDADGKAADVYSELATFEAGNEWTPDEVQTLTSLQDCVNEILHQIQTAENFTA
ncbi:MAG: hypothetical protein IJD01_05695 [Clostridia bacterium]|nr:hypothetical protein [Clostridia bacterium]